MILLLYFRIMVYGPLYFAFLYYYSTLLISQYYLIVLLLYGYMIITLCYNGHLRRMPPHATACHRSSTRCHRTANVAMDPVQATGQLPHFLQVLHLRQDLPHLLQVLPHLLQIQQYVRRARCAKLAVWAVVDQLYSGKINFTLLLSHYIAGMYIAIVLCFYISRLL